MPITITSPGTADLFRGRVRVWRGRPPAAVLAALAELIERNAKASGIYELRVTGATVAYSASPRIIINGSPVLR